MSQHYADHSISNAIDIAIENLANPDSFREIIESYPGGQVAT